MKLMQTELILHLVPLSNSNQEITSDEVAEIGILIYSMVSNIILTKKERREINYHLILNLSHIPCLLDTVFSCHPVILFLLKLKYYIFYIVTAYYDKTKRHSGFSVSLIVCLRKALLYRSFFPLYKRCVCDFVPSD